MMLALPVPDDWSPELDDEPVQHSCKCCGPLPSFRLGEEADEDYEDLHGVVASFNELDHQQEDPEGGIGECRQ